MVNTGLRLRADEAEDLAVISSCVQDAIARIEDMAYMPRLRRFAMVMTRFRWEVADEMGKDVEIRSGYAGAEHGAGTTEPVQKMALAAAISVTPNNTASRCGIGLGKTDNVHAATAVPVENRTKPKMGVVDIF